jgi:hypothetical protein
MRRARNLATILAAQMEVRFSGELEGSAGNVKIRKLKKMEFSIGKVRVRADS